MSKYLPILIFFILIDVVFDNSIFEAFETQSPICAFLLTIGMLCLQIFAAPIQASFSDLYCRKKSLVISLTISFISFIFLLFTLSRNVISINFLILILIVKSFFGNTLPLSWSAIADGQRRNLRFSLALGTGAYAIAYIVLAIFNATSSRIFLGKSWLSLDKIVLMVFLILAITVCLIIFRDIRDRHARHIHQENHMHGKDIKFFELVRSEFKDLLKDIKHTTTRSGMCSYFLWAIALYCPLLWLIDFKIHDIIVVIVMFGYLIGVGTLGFCRKIKDEIIIRSAFVIVITSLSLLFILNSFFQENDTLLSVCLFFFTLANAFLSPTILNLFSKERGIHQQGKGFGLIVSSDTAAFLVSCIVISVFFYFKLELINLILFSFFIFLFSWIPYSKYEKKRKDHPRITRFS